VSTSTIHDAAWSDAADLTMGMVRLSSGQATRRAVLHVQAAGDPPVPAELASWFTERGFQFYVAGVRLPLGALSARHAERDLRSVFADLDAASACLRGPDGMVSVIVTAQGRAAFAAALWSASRETSDGTEGSSDGTEGNSDGLRASDTHRESEGHQRRAGRPAKADALILSAPVWPARTILDLGIACPVLIVDGRRDSGTGGQRRARPPRQGRLRPVRPGRPGAPATQLGSHVTWLALTDIDGDRRLFLTELGRWLGAYMYGLKRDQLL
jgi:hypothetical protein